MYTLYLYERSMALHTQRENDAQHLSATGRRQGPAAAPLVGTIALVIVVTLVGLLYSAGIFPSSAGTGSSPSASTTPAHQTVSDTKASATASATSEDPSTTATPTSVKPAPVEDTSPLDSSASAQIQEATTDGIYTKAPAGFVATPTYQHLCDAVTAFERKGYDLGFILVDIASGRTISYNAETRFYPASSIKAAYCAAVYETQTYTTSAAALEQTIVNSSNDAYHQLIDTYGTKMYGDWLTSHGAPIAGADAYTYFYPNISATELLSIWKEIYRFGTSDQPAAQDFTTLLAQTNHSGWGALLRDNYTVWSKAGWYPDDGSGLQATADAGVIFSDCGDYVCAVLSDAPDNFAALTPVLDALNAAHGKMCRGSSALLAS